MDDRATPTSNTGSLHALHRLLMAGQNNSEARVDAVIAIAQHTVLLVSWPGRKEGFRTIVTSDGRAALPIFTSLSLLEQTASKFDWTATDGVVPTIEIGAREAMRQALGQQLELITVDPWATHSLTFSTEEVRPLLAKKARKDSTGPFSVHGRVSSTLMQAVRPSEHSPRSFAPSSPLTHPARSTTVNQQFSKVSTQPAPELLSALREVLRNFPEVQWACFGQRTQNSASMTSIGLRIDPKIRSNVNSIASAILSAGASLGVTVDTLLLDDLETIQHARDETLVFYP